MRKRDSFRERREKTERFFAPQTALRITCFSFGSGKTQGMSEQRPASEGGPYTANQKKRQLRSADDERGWVRGGKSGSKAPALRRNAGWKPALPICSARRTRRRESGSKAPALQAENPEQPSSARYANGSGGHLEDDAKFGVATFHAGVGFADLLEGIDLDHGAHTGSFSEGESVLGVHGAAGRPTLNIAASHQ